MITLFDLFGEESWPYVLDYETYNIQSIDINSYRTGRYGVQATLLLRNGRQIKVSRVPSFYYRWFYCVHTNGVINMQHYDLSRIFTCIQGIGDL